MLRQSDPGSPQTLEAVVAALAEEFGGIHSIQTIHHCVRDCSNQLADARVVDFIPLLVHRFARERLRDLTTLKDSLTEQSTLSS
jgi:hypothetical protein